MNTKRTLSIFHLKLRHGEVTLCGEKAEPERFTFDTLHNVTCAQCLSFATAIVHSNRSGKRGPNA